MSTMTSQTQSMHGFPAPKISSTQTFQSSNDKIQSVTAARISSQQVLQSVRKRENYNFLLYFAEQKGYLQWVATNWSSYLLVEMQTLSSIKVKFVTT